MNEVLPQQVVLTETYLQIYELDKDAAPGPPPAPRRAWTCSPDAEP